LPEIIKIWLLFHVVIQKVKVACFFEHGVITFGCLQHLPNKRTMPFSHNTEVVVSLVITLLGLFGVVVSHWFLSAKLLYVGLG